MIDPVPVQDSGLVTQQFKLHIGLGAGKDGNTPADFIPDLVNIQVHALLKVCEQNPTILYG